MRLELDPLSAWLLRVFAGASIYDCINPTMFVCLPRSLPWVGTSQPQNRIAALSVLGRQCIGLSSMHLQLLKLPVLLLRSKHIGCLSQYRRLGKTRSGVTQQRFRFRGKLLGYGYA